MLAIILAAGMGSRLGTPLPKALTLLDNGMSIMEWQISCLKNIDILAVVGFQKELIIKRFPNISYVINPDYSTENTSKSLLRALEGIDQDILWLNGDVVFHPKVLLPFLQETRPAMLVNKAGVGEEEIKYRLGKKGNIEEISKTVKDPQGEAVGINFFPKESLELLRQNLEKCELQDYFERGLQLSIDQGLAIYPVFCKKDECIEVDFPEDLKKANALIRAWS